MEKPKLCPICGSMPVLEEVDKVEKLLEWRNNMPNSEMYWYQKLLYCIAIGMTDESIAKQFDISTKMVNNIKEYYLKEGEKIKCQVNSKNKH